MNPFRRTQPQFPSTEPFFRRMFSHITIVSVRICAEKPEISNIIAAQVSLLGARRRELSQVKEIMISDRNSTFTCQFRFHTKAVSFLVPYIS